MNLTGKSLSGMLAYPPQATQKHLYAHYTKSAVAAQALMHRALQAAKGHKITHPILPLLWVVATVPIKPDWLRLDTASVPNPHAVSQATPEVSVPQHSHQAGALCLWAVQGG